MTDSIPFPNQWDFWPDSHSELLGYFKVNVALYVYFSQPIPNQAIKFNFRDAG